MAEESELYRCLEDAGINVVEPGEIEFNQVNLDAALDALVADAKKGLLRELYANSPPEEEFALSLHLFHPRAIPDTTNWPQVQKQYYQSNFEVGWRSGEWTTYSDAELVCYNIETDRVEWFYPSSIRPLATLIDIYENRRHTEEAITLVERLQEKGYRACDLGLRTVEEGSPRYGDLTLTNDELHQQYETDTKYKFDYKHKESAQKIYSQLVPGLD